VKPRYPIYVPSLGRFKEPLRLTARALLADDVPFRVVVEPQEAEEYERAVGADRMLVLPSAFSKLGNGSIPARNWIRDHAEAAGHTRHWCLDDNIRGFRRLQRGYRIPSDAGAALRACEELTDRYENVAISGLNYQMFVPASTPVPFYVNVHCYSTILVNHEIPYRWRGRYNEDADLCLQALSDGWCTLLLNAFVADKQQTMTMPGGNTDTLYAGDGRLKMAQALAEAWPGVAKVGRRYGRPQHVVDWGQFRAPLRRRAIHAVSEDRPDWSRLRLRAVREVRSDALRRLLDPEGMERAVRDVGGDNLDSGLERRGPGGAVTPRGPAQQGGT
jgi:hypothetical protein